jgi:hypothetical protein
MNMKKLITVQFKNLPNAAHYNFVDNVYAVISSASKKVRDALGDNAPTFEKLFREELANMFWVRKSSLTPEIADANRDMDAALTVLRTMVRSMASYTEARISSAAVRVYTMLMSYGNVNAKPYEEQSGDIRTIISQVSDANAYAGDIGVLKKEAAIIGNMIKDLKNAFDNFMRLLTQRDQERLLKPKRPFISVRRDIETTYRKIAVIVNAGAVMDESSSFDDFIDRLNPEIKRLNDEFHRARTRFHPAHTTIETIPVQRFAGKPVTPLPCVLVQTGGETLELELGKDFSVTYRNNDGAGMALLTVHGKGKYIGRINSTFYIAL